MFFCCLSCSVIRHGDKATEALKKKEQKELEKERLEEEKHKRDIQYQLSIQSKIARKRMIEGRKKTDKYYKKKLGQTFFQRLCPKKRKH